MDLEGCDEDVLAEREHVRRGPAGPSHILLRSCTLASLCSVVCYPAPTKVAEDDVVLLLDVIKSFGEKTAVKGVSLSIKEGQCFGLLGTSVVTGDTVQALTPTRCRAEWCREDQYH